MVSSNILCPLSSIPRSLSNILRSLSSILLFFRVYSVVYCKGFLLRRGLLGPTAQQTATARQTIADEKESPASAPQQRATPSPTDCGPRPQACGPHPSRGWRTHEESASTRRNRTSPYQHTPEWNSKIRDPRNRVSRRSLLGLPADPPARTPERASARTPRSPPRGGRSRWTRPTRCGRVSGPPPPSGGGPRRR